MAKHTAETLSECKRKLLELRFGLLNRMKTERQYYQSHDFSGDEGDLSSHAMAEHDFVINQNRIRFQLLEIDFALARLESGRFGICEETGEPIEVGRLLAIPWTRLSIEGAETREPSTHKISRHL